MEKMVKVTADEIAIAAWNLSYEQIKQIRFLSVGLFCAAAAGYLTYRFAKKQADRIGELEKTVNTLVQIAVSETNPEKPDIPEPVSE